MLFFLFVRKKKSRPGLLVYIQAFHGFSKGRYFKSYFKQPAHGADMFMFVQTVRLIALALWL